MEQIPKIKLEDGQQIPVVGLGTYARKANKGDFKQAVLWALEAGYRHIDTASCYKNEEEVGEAIAEKIKDGLVTRDELFVTTKLWNDCHKKENVLPALQESLRKLKLDYVNLYLIHWPISVDSEGQDMGIDFTETWSAMEEVRKLGLTRSIGVSNFNASQLDRILKSCQVKPVVNQIEINPTLRQENLVAYCKSNGVLPMAYTPLGLISEARPEFAGIDTIKTDKRLADIAQKYGKSIAQVGLRFLVQKGIPILPKSFTKSRIEQNIDLFDFELTDNEMSILESFDINHRCVPSLSCKHYKEYPF